MAVIAYHVVFTIYGYWLPNDPRGSWSDFVRKWELTRFGKATKTETRRSVAGKPHDRRLRKKAAATLSQDAVKMTGVQALSVAKGFGKAAAEGEYSVYACCILPDHVHIVIGRHERPLGRIVGHFKARASQILLKDGLWNKDKKSIWARGSWKVFLYRDKDVKRAIDYVVMNPKKEGKKVQTWPFVMNY
ncbi:MAG: transposase [Planctomycetota bacterium]|jgi:REP element-mobilizing transposase RayT